ncbi:hypothetical protein BWQ96_01997 [Gracilariopsis chorda]|uniref:Uncharacterized protein n=1 Tax=Gracilariopsis chorda TaxID=448386 RepID=A0A2V3J1N9_9FLOR|nr:hypothetical protein BWQ96_01997 [Gracilariopsis chorda]|eukprot:PXF48308.1 hypothetical protein BWQ96_01997 [Gracilariopsis chorda]
MLISEQNSHFRALCDDLRTMGDIKGPLYGMEMLTTVTEIDVAVQSGNYVVDATVVRNFLMYISSQVLNDFNSLSETAKGEVVTTLAYLFLSAYLKLSALAVERDPRNAASEARIPPTLPQNLSKLRPREFFSIVNSHRSRLFCTRIQDKINDIEAAFVDFKDTMRRDSAVQQHLSDLYDEVLRGGNLFQQSWQYFMPKFRKLRDFCGGLATVFPRTATVESDFSVIQWEKDDNRQNLTDAALEGNVQSKQYDLLELPRYT